MYEILMALPLFSGVSHDKLMQVVGTTKFHFLKFLPGERIITAGDVCSHIQFIISGSMRMSIESEDKRFRVLQTLSAPEVVCPDFLFGLATHYPCTAIALDTTGILQVDKHDYVSMLSTDRVFLYNYLNMLSVNAQKAVDGVLAVTSGTLEQRIAYWISALTQRSGKDIVLECRQRDLYSMFGVQRSSFINTLEDMKRRGLIDYTPQSIIIHNRARMIELLQSDVNP